jgi:hypothetical protein
VYVINFVEFVFQKMIKSLILVVFVTINESLSLTVLGPPCSFQWKKNATTVAGQLGSITATPIYLNLPIGIFIDLSDTLYVTDSKNSRIQKFLSGNTTGSTVSGGISSGSSSLNYPSDVTIDSKGNLYVADSDNNRVVMWRVNSSSGVIVAGDGKWENHTAKEIKHLTFA